MQFGDKNGTCECYDKEVQDNTVDIFSGWICENCWERIAESVISGE